MSGYLPLQAKIQSMRTEKGKKVKLFMAHGMRDNVVRYAWGVASKDKLVEMGQEVEWHAYRNLEHSAEPEEIDALERWLMGRLEATKAKA